MTLKSNYLPTLSGLVSMYFLEVEMLLGVGNLGEARNVLLLNLGDEYTAINMKHLVISTLLISALYDVHYVYSVQKIWKRVSQKINDSY